MSAFTETSKQVGDVNQLFVFAIREAAHEWLDEFDPEGVAFEQHVFGMELWMKHVAATSMKKSG